MKQFKVGPRVVKDLEVARETLNAEVERLRDDFDARSDEWRDSDVGVEVDAWLESLQSLVDSLEDFEAQPDV